jgi:addiction module HigA family antidote
VEHPGERLRLVLCGIDHSAEVRLNGTGLAQRTGMQTPLVVDLTPHLQPHNELRVTIQPAPKSRATPENRQQANATTKAAVSYTWDFHPRLIPLGLSRAARMEVIRTDGLENAELACEVAANQNLAGPTFALELPAAPQGLFELELTVEGRPGPCRGVSRLNSEPGLGKKLPSTPNPKARPRRIGSHQRPMAHLFQVDRRRRRRRGDRGLPLAPMRTKKLPLLTSSEMLREEFLQPMGITAYRLAKDIGVPLTRISAILAGKRAITADTGLRLDRYFGLSEGWWFRLETECELRRAKRELSPRIAREVRPRDPVAA